MSKITVLIHKMIQVLSWNLKECGKSFASSILGVPWCNNSVISNDSSRGNHCKDFVKHPVLVYHLSHQQFSSFWQVLSFWACDPSHTLSSPGVCQSVHVWLHAPYDKAWYSQEEYQNPAKCLYESHRVGHRSKIIIFNKVLTFRCIHHNIIRE